MTLPSNGLHARAPQVTDEWRERWPNFQPRELACKCCGAYFHDEKFLDKLQALRYLWDKPLRINSGHRCEKNNKAQGGAPRSQHLNIAVDISLINQDRHALADLAKTMGFTGIGYGSTFLHLDIREKPAQWYYPGSQQHWVRQK